MITIDSSGLPDTETWNNLWQYSVAINAMCLSGGGGNSGTAYSLGEWPTCKCRGNDCLSADSELQASAVDYFLRLPT